MRAAITLAAWLYVKSQGWEPSTWEAVWFGMVFGVLIFQDGVEISKK